MPGLLLQTVGRCMLLHAPGLAVCKHLGPFPRLERGARQAELQVQLAKGATGS